MIALLCGLFCQTPAIDAVRTGFMDIYPYYSVASLFEKYPYWDGFSWIETAKGKQTEVTFHGHFLQSKAVQWLQENNQYEWKIALKSMQLAKIYGTGDPAEDRVEVLIVFVVEADHSFAVQGGSLIFHGSKARIVKLTDKAVLEWIKATYRKRDPFAALIFGLPYE